MNSIDYIREKVRMATIFAVPHLREPLRVRRYLIFENCALYSAVFIKLWYYLWSDRTVDLPNLLGTWHISIVYFEPVRAWVSNCYYSGSLWHPTIRMRAIICFKTSGFERRTFSLCFHFIFYFYSCSEQNRVSSYFPDWDQRKQFNNSCGRPD